MPRSDFPPGPSKTGQLSPIAVFVYKRPKHTARLLTSLLANPEFSSSPVYVFADGARTAQDIEEVQETRRVARDLAPKGATFVERPSNFGLASSIIDGVSTLVGRHGQAIVFEDDLVVSPYVLRYFNEALELYRDSDRVMHVSGYMFPVKAELPETFFYREATCWGWATWRRAWSKFEPDGRKIREAIVARGMRHEFDVRGSMGFLSMLDQQIAGQVNSWAIRWYGSMRMADGLALHPRASLVSNLGFDGTGEHCTETSAFDVQLAMRAPGEFPDRLEECEAAVSAMIEYRRAMWAKEAGFAGRARRLLRRIVGRR